MHTADLILLYLGSTTTKCHYQNMMREYSPFIKNNHNQATIRGGLPLTDKIHRKHTSVAWYGVLVFSRQKLVAG